MTQNQALSGLRAVLEKRVKLMVLESVAFDSSATTLEPVVLVSVAFFSELNKLNKLNSVEPGRTVS